MIPTMPLKRVARIISGQSPPSSLVSDLDASGQPFLQGNAEFGPMYPEPKLQCIDAPKRAATGDILLSVRAPVGALNVADRPYGIGRGLCAVRPITGLDPSFAWWALVATAPQLFAVATGSTYEAVTIDDVGGLLIPNVPLPDQRGIAQYLDKETARIDALVTAKRRMLDLLENHYWSGIAQGIQTSSSRYVPLRRFLTRITDGPFGSALKSSDYSDTGARVVRLGNIGRGYFRDEDTAFVSLPYFQSLLRHRVMPGDLLIAGLGDKNNPVGRACTAPDLGAALVKADCYCASIDHRRADTNFLALFLSSPLGQSHTAMAARGTTRSRINLDIARDIRVPDIPVSMQREIVRAAGEQKRSLDELGRSLVTQMRLLNEYRQSLITAAVAGQLDIPEAA